MTNKDIQLYEPGETKKLSETALRTRDALNKIINAKNHSNKVTTLSNSSTNNDSSFVKYTSAQIADLSNKDGEIKHRQRVIKIKDEKVDPMLPSSFRIRKTPAGPQTDSIVPVLHDEVNSEKLTKADQKKWQIAPSISNWKNTNGFIIGIDNRIKNSQNPNKLSEEEIVRSTEKFSALSNALKDAEKKAKEDLKAKASWRKRKEDAQNNETHDRVSRLAEASRNERENKNNNNEKTRDEIYASMTKEERRAERKRRAQEEAANEKISTKDKIRKLAREQGRDVSERVVLSVSEALKKKQKESIYDSNLYFKPTDAKDETGDLVYDKPLFSQTAALNNIYRSRNLEGFKGLGSSKDDESESTAVKFTKDDETSIISDSNHQTST